jgi:hypothetical protein
MQQATRDLFFPCVRGGSKPRILIQDFNQSFPLSLDFLVEFHAKSSWLAANET